MVSRTLCAKEEERTGNIRDGYDDPMNGRVRSKALRGLDHGTLAREHATMAFFHFRKYNVYDVNSTEACFHHTVMADRMDSRQQKPLL